MNKLRTNNQMLWSNCYWGTGEGADDQVIINRNEFAEKWNGLRYYKNHIRLKENHHNNGGHYGYDVKIKKARKKAYPWYDAKYGTFQGIHFDIQYHDHSEYYILPDKRKMILFHPYNVETIALDYITANGFIMIPELYAKNCYSFCKIV